MALKWDQSERSQNFRYKVTAVFMRGFFPEGVAKGSRWGVGQFYWSLNIQYNRALEKEVVRIFGHGEDGRTDGRGRTEWRILGSWICCQQFGGHVTVEYICWYWIYYLNIWGMNVSQRVLFQFWLGVRNVLQIKCQPNHCLDFIAVQRFDFYVCKIIAHKSSFNKTEKVLKQTEILTD